MADKINRLLRVRPVLLRQQFRHELRACLSGEREVANLTVQATNRRGKPAECIVTCTPLFGKGQIQGVIVMVDEVPPA